MGKGAGNWYLFRLPLNMHKLSQGEYTWVIKFFLPSTDKVTVSVVSTSLNISQQSTKLFLKYSRSINHLHKFHFFIAFLIYAPKIKRRRALLVQMEQMLFIVSINFLMKKRIQSSFVLNYRGRLPYRGSLHHVWHQDRLKVLNLQTCLISDRQKPS